MMLILIFFAFLQIGATAFGGGYASLPLIQQVIVEQYKWLNATEFIDVITISQMTPGPIAINAATFVGMKIGGFFAAVIATIGNIIPQTIIMIILAHYMFNGKKIIFLEKMLKALRPGVVGLITSAALTTFITAIFPSKNYFDIIAFAGFVISFILYIKKVSIFKIISLSAFLGLILTLLNIK